MKYYLIAIFIIIGILPTSVQAQNYRLQVGLFQDAVSSNYFDNIKGSESIKHEVNHVGLHCYFIDGFVTKEAAEHKKLELKSLDNRFLTAQVISAAEVAACKAACDKKNKFIVEEDEDLYLSAVLFKSGSTRVRSEGRRLLKKVATYLKEHPNYTLLLEGHTDAVGDPTYNMKLAKQRAKSVRDSLGRRGIPSYRIHIDVYGESKPAAINEYDPELDSPESRAYNRRVDLTILDGMQEPKYSSVAEREIPLEFQIIEEDKNVEDINHRPNKEVIMVKNPPQFLAPEASLGGSLEDAQ